MLQMHYDKRFCIFSCSRGETTDGSVEEKDRVTIREGANKNKGDIEDVLCNFKSLLNFKEKHWE